MILFPAPGGGHINLHNWRTREWYPALEAAGLPRRGPYSLRHTFATNALAHRTDSYELSRWMSTSVAMIGRTYGHLTSGSAAAFRARLDAGSAQTGVEEVSEGE